MVDTIGPVLEQAKSRWMVGGEPSIGNLPPALAPILDGQGGAEADLVLLTLAGQYQQLCLRPVSPGDVASRGDLPDLEMPALAPDLRPLFRRLVSKATGNPENLPKVLALMANRGVSAHPADWLPKGSEEGLPAIYAPWTSWADARQVAGIEIELTAETWDEFYPAERRDQLILLRRSEPAAARALLAEKAQGEVAEARLKLIETLAIGLDPDDADYLESLETDRSGKVKAFATTLLARLGRAGDPELAGELVDMLDYGAKGFVRRSMVLAPKKLKNDAQIKALIHLLEMVAFPDLAHRLGCTADEVATAWKFEVHAGVDFAFVDMAARTAPDTVIEIVCARLAADKALTSSIMRDLLDRLETDRQNATLRTVLENSDYGGFDWLLNMFGSAHGGLTVDVLKRAPMMKAVRELVRRSQIPDDQADYQHRMNETRLAEELRALGLLVPRAAATALIEDFTAAGLHTADPRLDMLRFNQALPERNQTP